MKFTINSFEKGVLELCSANSLPWCIILSLLSTHLTLTQPHFHVVVLPTRLLFTVMLASDAQEFLSLVILSTLKG